MSNKRPVKDDKEIIAALRKEVRRLKKKLTEKNKLIKTCHEEIRVFQSKPWINDKDKVTTLSFFL